MWIIGCDYHPSFQQIAFLNQDTGEYGQRRLEHTAEAEQFYRRLRGEAVRIGVEASGQARWFERLLAELGHELWVGDPAAIRAAVPRKQKTDLPLTTGMEILVESRCNRCGFRIVAGVRRTRSRAIRRSA